MSTLTAMLAQSSGFFSEAAPPAPLPPPPFLEGLFFESPWRAVFVLICAAIVAHLVLRFRSPRLGLVLPLVAGLLCIVLIALSFAVTTHREQLALTSEALVDAVARADGPAVDELLMDHATLTLLGRPTNLAKPDILRRVVADMSGRYAVTNKQATTSRIAAALDGPQVARTQFRVQAVAATMNIPVGMWWTAHWRYEVGRWRVTGLELVSFDGVTNSSVIAE